MKKWLPPKTFEKLVFLGGRDKYEPVLSSVMGEGTLQALYELFPDGALEPKGGKRAVGGSNGGSSPQLSRPGSYSSLSSLLPSLHRSDSQKSLGSDGGKSEGRKAEGRSGSRGSSPRR